MRPDRCPSCAAAVRKDADWCTLCYTDLRPAPAPVQRAPYPQPSAPPAYAAPAAAPATADALHAPYEHVLAAVYGGPAPQTGFVGAPPPPPIAPAAPADKSVGWPCSQCGELNDFERLSCSVCMAAFGAGLGVSAPVVDRKRVMMYAIGFAACFLVMMAAVTFALTKQPTDISPPSVPEVTEPAVVRAPVEEPAPQPALDPAVPGQIAVPGQTAVPGQQLPGQQLPGQEQQSVPGLQQPPAEQIPPGGVVVSPTPLGTAPQ